MNTFRKIFKLLFLGLAVFLVSLGYRFLGTKNEGTGNGLIDRARADVPGCAGCGGEGGGGEGAGSEAGGGGSAGCSTGECSGGGGSAGCCCEGGGGEGGGGGDDS